MRHDLSDMHIALNIVSRGEHVPEAERFNRTVKERCRSNFAMILFKRILKRMVVELLHNVVFYLNAIPWIDGISDLSPMTIIQGTIVDYNLHFRMLYGEYAQTRDATDNTMKPRTTSAIAMGPNRNFQGVAFFSLTTERIFNRSGTDYTPLPMPQDAIDCVAYMTKNAPLGLTFTDYHDEAYATEFDDDDEDTIPANITDHSDSDNSSNEASASDSDQDSESTGDSDSDTDDDDDDPMGLNDDIEGVIDTPTEYDSDESEAMEDTIDTTGVDAEEAPNIGTTGVVTETEPR